MMHLIFWIVLVTQLAISVSRDPCRENIEYPYPLFSTFTPYEFVRGQSTDPVEIPQCQPIQYWMLARHGTRYTREYEVKHIWNLVKVRDEVLNNHDEHRGRLCCKDRENLKAWTPQAFTTVAMTLTTQGYKDMYNMALRWKSRFPTLFNQTYKPDRYEVRFTDHQRTTASAVSFLEGLFGSTHNVRMPEPECSDKVIKASHYCKNWKTDVADQYNTSRERKEFDKGPEIEAVRKNVSTKLGFEKTLAPDVVDAMYTACRLEKAWNLDKASAWCAAFSNEDLEVLLYREDLKYYYLHGDGNQMNKVIGCLPANDFLVRFSNITNGGKQPRGVFYFSHDRELHLLYSYLGIAIDKEPLTHTNYEEMKDRKWQTSRLSPFAGNLAAVFFKCDAGEQYRVQFYLHETPLELEGCNNTLCDWSYIKERYGPIPDSCDLSLCTI